jgi:hypothetical protein
MKLDLPTHSHLLFSEYSLLKWYPRVALVSQRTPTSRSDLHLPYLSDPHLVPLNDQYPGPHSDPHLAYRLVLCPA